MTEKTYTKNQDAAKWQYDSAVAVVNRKREITKDPRELDQLEIELRQINRRFAVQIEHAKAEDEKEREKYAEWRQRKAKQDLEEQNKALQKWLLAGGTEKDFNANWEAIKLQVLKEKAIEGLKGQPTEKINL